MSKKKQKNKTEKSALEKCFGDLRKYHFFLVKSKLCFYSFALQLNKQLGCTLSYSGTFSPTVTSENKKFTPIVLSTENPTIEPSLEDNSVNAIFCFLYSQIPDVNKGSIYVVENKTTDYDQIFFNTLKKISKHNLNKPSFFKEECYLLGNESKFSVIWKFSNDKKCSVSDSYDYIIIVSHDKDSHDMVNPFLHLLESSKLYSITNIYEYIKPYIPSEWVKGDPIKKREKKNAISYLLELCQTIEIKKNDFEMAGNKKRLGNKEIPAINQIFVTPFKNVQIEEEYISLLSKDSTFE